MPVVEQPDLFKEPLSPREVEVLQLISQGRSNAEVGRALFISQETVKSHMRHILSKTGMPNRAGAIGHAFRKGEIQ